MAWVSKPQELSNSQASNTHKAKECQDSMDNTNSNSQAKEVATIREEEAETEVERAVCLEVECNLCQWVDSLRDKECLTQDRCNSK